MLDKKMQNDISYILLIKHLLPWYLSEGFFSDYSLFIEIFNVM